MSTLDVVAYAGEEFGGVKPANFLDIGGGASAEVMADGLEIILGDPAVKSVFVNVFGGITSCDSVAAGIIQAFGLLADRGETPDKPRSCASTATTPSRAHDPHGGRARSDRDGGHHGRRGPAGRPTRGTRSLTWRFS